MPRHLAIGDIHGCLNALNSLLDYAELQTNDVLITLGDYVDRGPDSKGVLNRLIELDRTHHHCPIRGNHEIMMLYARESDADFLRWKMVGGDAALSSYGLEPGKGKKILNEIPDEHWRFIKGKLLPFYETETHFFVHANADPHLDLEDQPDYMLYWEHFNYPVRHQSGKIMVCGHTSQKCGLPLKTDDAICIDTWACGTGWLSCLDVEAGILFQANQQGKTRRMSLDECP